MGTRRLSSEHGEFTLFFTLNSPFSNFYPCNFEAEAIDKKVTYWNCVEHFYMYNKAVSCGNRQAADAIFPLNDAKRIKRIGAELIEVDKAEWAEMSGSVMKTALKAKYSQNPELRYLLFMTYGSKLVECSPQDRVWGIGLAIESDFATNPSRWRGENKLGKIMDEVRDEMWNEEEYIEERTKVEDGLGIPGFAAAYFDAKFPFTPTSFGVSTSEFVKDRESSYSNKRNSHEYRNGSGRKSYVDRRRDHSRERRRDSDRGRKRSPFTPPTRRRSRRSPTSRSPAKKRSRRDRSSSASSSGSSRTPSPGEWQQRNNRRHKSPSPANGENGAEEKPKSSADLIAEFLREHVQGVKPETEEEKVEEKVENGEKEEKAAVLGPELPAQYKLEKSPEKEEKRDEESRRKRNRRESDSSPEGRRRSRSKDRKKREESRRKRSRSRSKERRNKKTYRKSRSPARYRNSSKKSGSRHDDSRDAEKRRSGYTEKSSRKEDGERRKAKENRESAERKTKTPSKSAPPPQKKEKSEEEKRKEMMMQKLMSGLMNKNKAAQYLQQQQYQQYPQY